MSDSLVDKYFVVDNDTFLMSLFKRVYAVRGAVCCENTKQSITKQVSLMYDIILRTNKIREKDIVSIQFSLTSDLTVLNPATALRITDRARSIPLFVSAEAPIAGGLSFVVRALITYYGRKTPQPVYLNGAEILRPDLRSNISGVCTGK